MTKLEKLINELCPNGVEYKKLKEVSEMKRGTSVTKKDITEGDIPVISGGREPAYYCDKYNRDGETITVAGSGAGAGYVQYWTKPIFVCDAFSVKGLEFIQTKYLYYCLANMQEVIYSTKKGSGVPHVHISCIENIKIPTPPIEVQREIVRILDNFTELTAELTAELAAELTARRKQYEYYADKLFKSNIPREEWKTVEETIVSLKTGLNPRQNFRLNDGGDKSYITGKDIYKNSINVSSRTDLITDDAITLINRRACLATNDVLFASTGTGTVGRMAVVENYDNTWAVSETMFCLKPKPDVINPYYLMYVLYTQSAKDQFAPKISKGSVPHLKVKDLLSVKIPVPNLIEQERIVSMIRRFDALCNDISAGLPAEIEARQKQYEYYRDKLLTFKELSV